MVLLNIAQVQTKPASKINTHWPVCSFPVIRIRFTIASRITRIAAIPVFVVVWIALVGVIIIISL